MSSLDSPFALTAPHCVLPGPRPLPRAVRPGALPGLAVEDLEQNVDV